MKLINEKNISRGIIYVFIVIMSLMIFSMSYIYIKKTYYEFDEDMKIFVKEYYNKQKELIKKKVDVVVDVLEYNNKKSDNEEELKQDAINLINSLSFQEHKSNYFFVYDVYDFKGGDRFARQIVNPNRPDIVGKFISTNYKDKNGKKFREEFLKGIREKGEAFSTYIYKKPVTDTINKKLSYFKLYPKWNWIIATGIYTDDIQSVLEEKKKQMKKKIKVQIFQSLFMFLMFLSLAILLSQYVAQKIEDYFENYKKEVKAKSDALLELNETLEKRVHEEIEKNREKEQILIQKSKFIALGEMISNIAHQWRQPLSELSSLFMAVKFRHDIGKLDQEYMEKKAKESENIIEYMSHTIDDFRNFFMPKKEKQKFYISKVIDSVMTITGKALSNNGIEVNIDINEDIELYTYKNEYEQVVLNILSNAKDILIARETTNPQIKIYTQKSEGKIKLIIEDNAGGISKNIIDKIFEPYFSTKEDSNGTGLGLYMSKIIVEKNMNGKLKVRNTKDGARFVIIV